MKRLVAGPATLLAPLLALALLAAPAALRAQTAAPPAGAAGAGESWGDAPAPEGPSTQPDAPTDGIDARLRARAEAFYGFLQGKRVNVYSLYTNETFRDFFTTEEALQNYVAFLTNALAKRRFKKYQIERVEDLVLTMDGPDEATARIKLVGRHVHVIFFWDVTETIDNHWKRVGGDWFVFPPPF